MTVLDREEIKKQQKEVGAVADGIPGYETLDKTIKYYKKKYGIKEDSISYCPYCGANLRWHDE